MGCSKVHAAVYTRSRLAPDVGEVVGIEHVVAPFLVVKDEFLGVDAMIPLAVVEVSMDSLG